MQAVLSAVTQELAGPLQSRDKLHQLLLSLLHSLKQQKANRADVPPGAVSSIANAISVSATDSHVVLTGLRCLQQVMLLLPHAALLLRNEGGCRAVLAVLQSPLVTIEAAGMCLNLLTQLSINSVALMSLVDMGMMPSLLNVLVLHHSVETLVLAVLQLFIAASKVPEGAVVLSDLHISPAVGRVLSQHQGNNQVCDAALKCLRRVAKQPSCRQALVAAETVQLLVEAAQQMAGNDGWYKQVKRACRAIWLLCQNKLTPLPSMEPCWSLPGRTSAHLNLADALGNDVQRLHELFPELQAVLRTNQPHTAALRAETALDSCPACAQQEGAPLVAAGCQELRKLGLQLTLRPPSVAQLMEQLEVSVEAFHTDNSRMAVACMLKDLSRLQRPPGRVVYDCTQPSSPCLLQQQPGVSGGCCRAGASPCPDVDQGCSVTDDSDGFLQFSSAFESGNLRLVTHVAAHEYDLFLSNDVSNRTCNHNSAQWFYFAVCNGKPNLRYRFNLVNFNKPESLYASCKQPLMCCGQPVASQPVGRSPSQPAGVTCSARAVEAALEQQHRGAANPANGLSSRAPETEAALPVAGSQAMMCTATQHTCLTSSACCWQRVGSNICYHASPYRGRPVYRAKTSAQSASSSSTERDRASDSAGGGASGSYRKSSRGGSTTKLARRKSQTGPTASAAAVKLGVTNSCSRSTGESCPADMASAAGSCQSLASAQPSDASADSYGPGLYCLSFDISFPCSGLYYLCSCYPYTYSDLQQQLARLALHSSKLLICEAHAVRSLLCYSLAGQRCDLLTITDFNSSAAELASREYVFITARIHPGETCASWVMQGIIKFLVSTDPVAERLRQYFVFKVVPMLNPDGVVMGNTRCSLAAVDLNRCWDKAVKEAHPTIYHARKLMEALAEPGRLALTIDIHGHSTITDAFFYGCEPQLVKPAKVAQAAHHLKTADAVSATATSKSSSNGSCEPACPASLCSMDQLCVMGTSCRASSKVAATEAETLVQLSQLEQSTGHGTQVPAVCECGHSTATSDTGLTVCAMPPFMGSAVRDSSAKQATNSPQSSGCDSSAVDLASLSPAASKAQSPYATLPGKPVTPCIQL